MTKPSGKPGWRRSGTARWDGSRAASPGAPHLARALAQSPDLLLLDEPTNHLDPPGRSALLSLVKNKEIAVIAVLHDLPVAEAFADRILVLNESRQVACGTPEAVLQTPVILPVFGMNSFKVAHPVSGKTLRIFDVPHCA